MVSANTLKGPLTHRQDRTCIANDCFESLNDNVLQATPCTISLATIRSVFDGMDANSLNLAIQDHGATESRNLRPAATVRSLAAYSAHLLFGLNEAFSGGATSQDYIR